MAKNYSRFHEALFGDNLAEFERVVARRRSYSFEDFKLIFNKKYPQKAKKARLLLKNYKPTTEQIMYMIDNDYSFFFGMLAESKKLTREEEAYLFNHGSEQIKTSFSLKTRWGNTYEERFVKSAKHYLIAKYYGLYGMSFSDRLRNLCLNRVG